MSELTKIKDVSARYEVTTGTLRYYEKMGLIESTRDENSGYRLYNETALTRLRQILILRKMGISIGDIARIVAANNSDTLFSVLDEKVNNIDSEVALLHDLKIIVLEFIRQLRQIDFRNDSDVKMLYDKAIAIEASLTSESVDLAKFLDISDEVDEQLTGIAVESKETDASMEMIKFEIVEFPAYRFIGKSVYSRAGMNCGRGANFAGYLWENSTWIFEKLDELKEYATDEVHNAALLTWNKYDRGGDGDYGMHFGPTHLLGYTAGRFMKADTPVAELPHGREGLDYIDIPAMFVAKGWFNKEDDGSHEDLVREAIAQHGYTNAPWKFMAEVDGNGYYVACEISK